MAKLYPCKHCANYVSVSAKTCTKCGKDLRFWFEKVSFKAVCILVFIGLLSFLLRNQDKEKLVAKEETNQPVIKSATQNDLIEIHKIALTCSNLYANAENDIQKSDAYRQMIREIQNLLVPYQGTFKNWEGKLINIQTIGKGGEELRIRVSTITNGKSIIFESYCPLFGSCGINRSNPIYDMVRNSKEGDKVQFSGKFLLDKKGNLAEDSFTEKGSIIEPEFKIEFTEIKGISLPVNAE